MGRNDPNSNTGFSNINTQCIKYLWEDEIAPETTTTTTTTTRTTTTTTSSTTTKAFDCYDGNNAGCTHICDQVRYFITRNRTKKKSQNLHIAYRLQDYQGDFHNIYVTFNGGCHF